MIKENWSFLYEPALISSLLLMPSALCYWSLNRLFKAKDPNSFGLSVVEDLPTQISVRIGQPGNLYQLKKEGPFKKRLVLDLNPMEESSRNYALYLIKLAGKFSGIQIIFLGANVYSVQGSLMEYLPSDSDVVARRST